MNRLGAAIAQTVKPGSVVLDLASGTGILALLAVRAGAAKVYAVECGNVIDLATAVVEENQWHERIQFIRGMSTEVTLPEKVDVILSDQLGYFGFNAGVFEFYADACRRFLRPGGVTVPQSITLHCVPVESPNEYAKVDFWRVTPHGFSMQSIWRAAVNSIHPANISKDRFLADPIHSPALPMSSPHEGLIRLHGELRITRDAALHGLAGFFSAQLCPGVILTNSPLDPHCINRSVSFLPVETPIPVRAGDTIDVNVLIRPVEQLISWTLTTPAGISRHSSFRSLPVTAFGAGGNAACIPPLSSAKRFVLERCDGQHSVATIAAAVREAFPQLFPAPQAAIAFTKRQTTDL